ncbi:MAG: M3 family metallopeptidase [Acidobacteria bacterium]|nr:M3 family metallopeptidase [Acidobacteriota bacterium]
MRSLWLSVTACALMAAENPLLEIPERRPAGSTYRLPFDQVKPEHIVPAMETLLAEAEQQRQALATATGPRTWDNTMQRLENMGERLSHAFSVVSLLEGVATTPEHRKAFNAVLPKISAFGSSVQLDLRLAKAVKEYSETAEAKALTGVRARYLSKTLNDFRRGGAYLDDAKRKRLQEINEQQSAVANKFSQNALDARIGFELLVKDEKQLAGLPESARKAAQASAKAKSKEGWRFTLAAPSYQPVLQFLDDGSIRKQMWLASNTLASSGKFDNSPLIRQMLALRAEEAQLLGYANFADRQTEERMAKSGAGVRKFLEDLEAKSKPAYEKENAELAAFRKSMEGPNAPALEPWDIPYYSEKLRKKLYDFDEEALRPYFPADKVVDGMFQLVNKLYGISIKPVENKAVWAPEVKFYEIRDQDGTLLASFYADFYPRDNKRAGAWMSPLVMGGPLAKGGFEPHIGLIAANITTAEPGKPALLNHYEVETLFHEFGHLLHMSLSRSPIKSLGGTSVAWDFVELPSQIMENFTWERPVVDLFAKHYESGQPVPAPLFDAMKKARTFRGGYTMMRQLSLGMTDILFHTEYRGDDSQGDPVAYARKVMQRYSPAPLPEGFSMVTSFSHIFAGGYAAGYYSYKWAEVLDADAFTRFKKEGLFNAKAGDAFRRSVLEKGNTEEAGKLFRDFMGRNPDPKALLERSGLATK